MIRGHSQPTRRPLPRNGGVLQRKCACGQHSSGECGDCRKEREGTLQRAAITAVPAPAVPEITYEVLRSPGQPLDGSTRAFMETRMTHSINRYCGPTSHAATGLHVTEPRDASEQEADRIAQVVASDRTSTAQTHTLPRRDFSQVRVHTGAAAARAAEAMNAAAYTVGDHIVFGQGRYAPQTRAGVELLAHELTHTVQQRQASPLVMRQEAVPGLGGASQAYDGCRDRDAMVRARADASRMVSHAVDLLGDRNLQRAAPLLSAHFHLDPTRPSTRDDLQLLRGQFGRMAAALGSGIRIVCRSAPRPGTGAPPPSMPVDDECRTAGAHSTSCAAGNATALVTICESTLLGMGDGPLVKTLMHEFTHVACNGMPRITSGGRRGGEVYYDGDALPGTQSNVLTQADSYAWFALQANRVATEAPSATRPAQRGGGRSRAPWWGVLGVGAALTLGALAAPGLLLGGLLGLALGGAGLLGLFD